MRFAAGFICGAMLFGIAGAFAQTHEEMFRDAMGQTIGIAFGATNRVLSDAAETPEGQPAVIKVDQDGHVICSDRP